MIRQNNKYEYKNILIFDTSIASENLGDLIIMEAVQSELRNIFRQGYFVKSLTHDIIGGVSRYLLSNSDYSFIGGTNLLTSRMNCNKQWRINLIDSIKLKKLILMGVGWHAYEGTPNCYSSIILKSILNHDIIHSVRDQYTADKLVRMGITNVINTGCPTMWKLDNKHCLDIPKQKAENVVTTFTYTIPDEKRDFQTYHFLKNSYKKVFIWLQGSGDYSYASKFVDGNVNYVQGTLDAYDELLSNNDMDYVGTRLHAGIRALQYKRRTIIIGIDNRAIEIGKDFMIPVINRSNIHDLKKIINDNFETMVNLPIDRINKWKNQF